MSTRDEVIEQYRDGYERGREEYEELRRKGLIEGVVHGVAEVAFVVGTLGLSEISKMGWPPAFEAGYLDGKAGEDYNPDAFLENQSEKEHEAEEQKEKEKLEKQQLDRKSRGRDGDGDGGDDDAWVKLLFSLE